MAKTNYLEECIETTRNSGETIAAQIANKELLMLLDENVKLKQALERIVKAQHDDTPLSNLNSMVREGRDVLINLD